MTQRINTELHDHRSKVKFNNFDDPCIVITSEKAAMDAKNFREAASLLNGVGSDRAKPMAQWLMSLAEKYET